MKLTQRDTQILICLSRKVRLFSVSQIAKHWWSNTFTGIKNCRRRLLQLSKSGWISAGKVTAQQIDILKPLVCWEPGEPECDLGAIAWILQSRWTDQPKQVSVFFATKFGAQQFGSKSPGVLRKPKQASHDLGLSSVLLCYLNSRKSAAEDWIGEDIFAGSRKGEVLPDALLFSEDSTNPYRAVEFGGAYDKQRLQHFHDDCKSRHLAYEIW